MVIVIGGGGRPPEYVRVPPAFVERVRTVSALLGFTIIVLSVVTGIVALPWTFALPTAENPLTFLVVGFVLIQVLFGVISGIIAVAGRSCVSTGQLDRTAGSGLFRMNMVFLVFTEFCTVLSWLLMAAVASTADSGFTLEVLAFLLVNTVPAILTIVSVFGASRLVRASPGVLRKYGGW